MASLQTVSASNVGVIHLSDIHFSIERDYLHTKWELLFRALRDDFHNCVLYVVISGDLGHTGKPAEYKIAESFLKSLKERLLKRYPLSQVKFVIVPGNHDCNFGLDSQVRKNAVKNISYENIGQDDSVIRTCLQVQTNFWDFYNRYTGEPHNKLYYRVVDSIAGKSLCFHCFNTAWMSQVDEKPGTLFFPVQSIQDLKQRDKYDVNVAVFHHPLNWFNPNENNKREFQNLLDDISSLQIVGHEHENELRKTENLDSANSRTVCSYGDVLQDTVDAQQSGFQTFFINLQTGELKLRRYRWEKNLYQSYSEKEIILSKKYARAVEVKSAFIEKINRINIPIALNDKQVTLSELYVFPDLEALASKSKVAIDDFIDSEMALLNKNKHKFCILEGESQIGKSSLLYMLFLKYYENGYYPILLKGNEIVSDDIDKIVSKAFKDQYSEAPIDYDRFRQLDSNFKILFIDDMHTSNIDMRKRHNLINKCCDLYGRTIVTIYTANSILPENRAESKDIYSYSIKPLGYKKSNDLVDKYLKLRDTTSIDDPSHFEKTKHTFNQVRQILGDRLIPSYPVFVLSIAQALEFVPLNLNETSYGYCYQTLIHYALSSAGVSKDNIDAYINIITELAFHMFKSETLSISESGLQRFYEEYQKTYIAPGFETVKKTLLRSRVLKEDSGSVFFGYKYILYFLAAKKIAEMIEKPEGMAIVKELYDNVHKERNANILVLITHHTKNTAFIEESILNSMLPLENVIAITLEKGCSYYKLLEDVFEEIEQVIELNRDPLEERKKQLIAQDKRDRAMVNNAGEKNDSAINEKTLPFLRAFRSIEIVGQIVKNRKGSLEKSTIKEMIMELYNTGFRMIGYLGELIVQAKDDLAMNLGEQISKRDSREDIEKKIYKFLQFISLWGCLGVFTKFIHSVGIKELRDIYSEVAMEMNTPAAKIVSFSINSYYGKIDMKELEQLGKEFRGNEVALDILRARVRAYVYNNHVDYKEKQKLAVHLGMRISPAIGYRDKGQR